MTELQEEILRLKDEKEALILAHYYQDMEIQAVADHVCDSFEMARLATTDVRSLLMICGVHFMAQSAKILNPSKTVLLPVVGAGCPMADDVQPEDVIKLRELYPDAAVVCYINTSAAVKAVCDVCCTSSSAITIVRALPEKRIIFVPDRNLCAFISSKVPEKEFIPFDGCCPIHDAVTESDALAAKNAHPGAKLLVHPECKMEVLIHADYIGSTSGIISEALKASALEFIIGTENGVVERLRMLAPEKTFHPITTGFICHDMRKTKLSDVYNALEKGVHEINLPDAEMNAASLCLKRMIDLA